MKELLIHWRRAGSAEVFIDNDQKLRAEYQIATLEVGTALCTVVTGNNIVTALTGTVEHALNTAM